MSPTHRHGSTNVFDKALCCFLQLFKFVLWSFNQHQRRVKFLSWWKYYLHLVLLLNLHDERCLIIGWWIVLRVDRQLKWEQQRCVKTNESSRSLSTVYDATDWHLVALFVRIGAVRVGEMDVSICSFHYAFDVVPATTNYERVIGVGYVHLQNDSIALKNWINIEWTNYTTKAA